MLQSLQLSKSCVSCSNQQLLPYMITDILNVHILIKVDIQTQLTK